MITINNTTTRQQETTLIYRVVLSEESAFSPSAVLFDIGIIFVVVASVVFIVGDVVE